MKQLSGVFFDCWDTLISFRLKNPEWNYHTLKKHAKNKDMVNWDEVSDFCAHFYHDYYEAQLDYELKVEQILQLMVFRFHIALDCSIETCSHEILIHLDPIPVKGIEAFLTYLDEQKIPYACLSNTVYSDFDTKALIEKLLPNHHFKFLLASSQIGVKKPNPIFFQTGVAMANLKLEECMYIGDKLLQDAYGSSLAGFGYSIWLNQKGDEEKQKSRLLKLKGISTVDCIEIKSYEELIERLNKNEITKSDRI